MKGRRNTMLSPCQRAPLNIDVYLNPFLITYEAFCIPLYIQGGDTPPSPSSHKHLSMLVEILISDKPVSPLPSRLNSFLRNARSATAFSMETEMAIELSEKQHSKTLRAIIERAITITRCYYYSLYGVDTPPTLCKWWDLNGQVFT